MLASKEAQIGGIPAEALMPTNQNSHVPNRKWSKNSGMDSISISLDSTKNNNNNNDNNNNNNNTTHTILVVDSTSQQYTIIQQYTHTLLASISALHDPTNVV
mmetsp:Transcript_1825/g.4762  ORF Transcript_1825/g.4762 Transcript_1825/m.4762 type:complete len:102 (+) Transcript_1825:404-709(+)